MMIKGGIRLGGLGISGYDADAAAYFERAGVTDATAKGQINAFVKGVKDLGLWSSIVSWPLRSSQNAGTGLTAYSLGGLGTFDGTLSSPSGPTWGADGVIFDGTNDYISLPSNSFGTGNSATSIWAFSKNNSIASRQVVLSGGNQNSATNSFTLEHPDTGVSVTGLMAFTELTGKVTPATLAWKSVLIGNTTFGFFGYNGGAVSQTTLANAINKLGGNNAIGRMDNPAQNYFNGVVGAVIRIDATPTTSLNSSIHDLYKTTLGTGLGLP